MNNTTNLHSTTSLIGPQQARMMRETMNFPRQRKLSEGNIYRLAREMAMRRFIPGTQVYICVLPNGDQFIINGNHTLEAVSKSGEPQMLTLTYHAVPDENEAGAIYAVFDIHKARTWMDSLRATGRDVGVTMPQKVLPAVGIIQNDFDQRGSAKYSSRPDRISLLDDYKEAAELFWAGCAGAKGDAHKIIKRAAVLAVALETIRYQPSRATEFWSALAQDDGLAIGRPERALLSWLRNTKLTSGLEARAEHARASALAWNAAWRGEKPQYVKPNAASSFFLLGTPWDKGIGKSRRLQPRYVSRADTNGTDDLRPE